jgi:hypothetical protein
MIKAKYIMYTTSSLRGETNDVSIDGVSVQFWRLFNQSHTAQEQPRSHISHLVFAVNHEITK